MAELTNHALLKRFVEAGDQEAFRIVVQRHVRLVYGAALRQSGGDRAMAEEVCQNAFTLLARKAVQLQSHPALAGWLFATARNLGRDAARAAGRRRHWEKEASMDREKSIASVPEEDQGRLGTILDEALCRLREKDRTGVVLRFFEGQSFGEVGRALGIGEDAARLRVARALEKLRVALGRRGITSTAAVLESALASHGAVVVPAQLAGQVASAAIGAAAAATGAGGVVAAGIGFMSITKATVIVALLACGVAVYEGSRTHRAAKNGDEQAREAANLRAELLAAQRESRLARERARAADADLERILAAIDRAKATDPAVALLAKKLSVPTRAEVQQRFVRAQELAKLGRNDEAMAEFLWCFDQGMRGGFNFMNVRGKLIEAMGELAKTYSPMREALLQRRASAEEAMLVDVQAYDELGDFAKLARALGEPEALMAAFERLPDRDPRRDSLLSYGVFDQFLTQRRYREAVAARSPERMEKDFEMQSAISFADNLPDVEQTRTRMRQGLVESTAKNIEALAGAGEIAYARTLAKKVLEYDLSPETAAIVRERLARSGHPELAAEVGDGAAP